MTKDKAMDGYREIGKEAAEAGFLCRMYKLFWIYVICGVAGVLLETLWCWVDFQELTSRSSNLFFPISCVWGLGGALLYLLTRRNRWDHGLYIFVKCTVFGTVFEFLCGCLGERFLGVTFWDYSGMPLHMGRYVNLPFCLVWGLLGVLWVQKGCAFLEKRLPAPQKSGSRFFIRLFIVFMVGSQILTAMALLQMHKRQRGFVPQTRMEQFLDAHFTDQRLQKVFPKMKNAMTGKKIYVKPQ